MNKFVRSLTVGDNVLVKGRNGNKDFVASFRGYDSNHKCVVFDKKTGNTFIVFPESIQKETEENRTGVFNLNSLSYIYEDIGNGVMLSYHNALEEYPEEIADGLDYPGDDTVLIGFRKTEYKEGAWWWFETKDCGKYGFVPDEDAEYSAIVNNNEGTIQVVKSYYLIRGAMCSPCYPNQVDAGTEGDYLAYSVPPDMIEDNEEMTKRIFKKGENNAR